MALFIVWISEEHSFAVPQGDVQRRRCSGKSFPSPCPRLCIPPVPMAYPSRVSYRNSHGNKSTSARHWTLDDGRDGSGRMLTSSSSSLGVIVVGVDNCASAAAVVDVGIVADTRSLMRC